MPALAPRAAAMALLGLGSGRHSLARYIRNPILRERRLLLRAAAAAPIISYRVHVPVFSINLLKSRANSFRGFSNLDPKCACMHVY